MECARGRDAVLRSLVFVCVYINCKLPSAVTKGDDKAGHRSDSNKWICSEPSKGRGYWDTKLIVEGKGESKEPNDGTRHQTSE